MFFPYISCSERHVLYPRVYITCKIKKMCGKMKMKESPLLRAAPCRKNTNITGEHVLSGFLDITAASRLVGAADYTKHIRTCYLYTTHWALELHTGRPPYFCIPKINKTLPEPHARLSFA
jgi:hypothetical protein